MSTVWNTGVTGTQIPTSLNDNSAFKQSMHLPLTHDESKVQQKLGFFPERNLGKNQNSANPGFKWHLFTRSIFRSEN